MTFLEDPFVVEEEVPLQLACDVTTFVVLADAVGLQSDYSAKTSQKGKGVVCRLLWAPPLVQQRNEDVATGGTKVVRAADSRGRLVTPLGFSVRATNLTDSPLTWHVNTPYQEGSKDSAVVARVADKVVSIPGGQTRTHSHQWGNGAHLFPLRGLVKMEKNHQYYSVSNAIADHFFIRDKYGVANLEIPNQDLVRVEISVKYTLDKAVDVQTDLVETRRPFGLVDLGEFEALYHLDPVTVVSGPGSSPFFSTAEVQRDFLCFFKQASDNKVILANTDAERTAPTPVTKMVGVAAVPGQRVIPLCLTYQYTDSHQNKVFLNCCGYSNGKYYLLDQLGKPVSVPGAFVTEYGPAGSPCSIFSGDPVTSSPRRQQLLGGRVATSKGLNSWPEIVLSTLAAGTKILALLLGGGGAPKRGRKKSKRTTRRQPKKK